LKDLLEVSKYGSERFNIIFSSFFKTYEFRITAVFWGGGGDASFEAFMVMMLQVEIFWVVMSCSAVVGY
jgi:hypothetical protein